MRKLYFLLIIFISFHCLSNNENEKQLLFAAEKGDVKTVRQLLKTVDCNTQNKSGKSALHVTQDPAVIHELVIAGANVNVRDKNKVTPLLQALHEGNKHKAMLLLHSGANVNIPAFGTTPLMFALKNNDYELTCEIVKAGAKVKPKAIVYAQSYSSEKIVQFLKYYARYKGKKIDFAEFDKSGQTVMHAAVLQENEILIDALQCAGASINSKNKFGQAPIHIAVNNNLTTITQKLLALDAQMNILDSNGETPLHYAAKNGSFLLTQLLCQHGAQVHLGDKNGISAFNYIQKNERLAKLLPIIKPALNALT